MASGQLPRSRPTPCEAHAGQSASIRFNRLATLTRRRIYNHAYGLLGNASEAEDVTQDAFVRAWQHFAEFDSRRPFEPWVRRIVTNRVIDLRRRQKRVPVYPLDDPLHNDGEGQPLPQEYIAPDSDPATLVLASVQDEEIRRALAALTPQYQQMFHLTAAEQMSYQEIAFLLDCPLGTVRSRISRARAQMRQALQHTGGRQI